MVQPREHCFALASVSESKNLAKQPLRIYKEGPGGGGDGTSSEGAGIDAGGGVLCRVACQIDDHVKVRDHQEDVDESDPASKRERRE